jgi:hypothetical protein
MRSTMRVVVRFGILGAAAFGLESAGLGTFGLASACRMEPNPEPFEGGEVYCSGFTAKPIPAKECRGCSGGAFALCNGNTFSECTCELPSDYSLDAGTFEAESPPISNGAPVSVTFEAGRLPCCEGKVVREIPKVQCPTNCGGEVAWVICQDNAWTECACDIPDGYSLSDVTCDGG